MRNPYDALPDRAFWRRAVANVAADAIDPVGKAGFRIGPQERVATAGSCFAQHLSRELQRTGHDYYVAEDRPGTPAAADENYGVFSARFGNIYTPRQLLQLFERAYGLFEPIDRAWQRTTDDRVVDPFRPQIQSGGFASRAAIELDRRAHLDACRAMFEECAVFIFTLGLTEAWVSTLDGAVFPQAPGVTAAGDGAYAFCDFSAAELIDDLSRGVEYLRAVNPGVRIILTVSPVPLVASYSGRHVLTATSHSKARLLVAAHEVAARFDALDYFPSYEIITGQHARGAYFADDLREVRPEGVAHVMRAFTEHYLTDETPAAAPETRGKPALSSADRARFDAARAVICDEEALDRG